MVEMLWALGLAGFGGFIRHIQKFTVRKEERPPWEWSQVGIDVGTGAFAGLLTLWIIRKYFGEADYVHFSVAIAGYGGPLTLQACWEAGRDTLRRLLGAAPGGKDDGPKN